VHVLITGLVQGVSFRSSSIRKAESLGIKGWVRNLDNDKVEAVFEGPENKIKEMLEWCKIGPPSARVDNVKTEFADYREEFEGFERR